MITHLKGDATLPQGTGKKLIIHVCNDIGAWGAGFVLALDKRWDAPRNNYLGMKNYVLGNVQFVVCDQEIIVANMIAQHDIRIKENMPPIRYFALRKCLRDVNEFAKKTGATVHAPKFGAGLAGGDWKLIEKMIIEEIEVPTFIYEFQG